MRVRFVFFFFASPTLVVLSDALVQGYTHCCCKARAVGIFEGIFIVAGSLPFERVRNIVPR